jgi:hypothetical protein
MSKKRNGSDKWDVRTLLVSLVAAMLRVDDDTVLTKVLAVRGLVAPCFSDMRLDKPHALSPLLSALHSVALRPSLARKTKLGLFTVATMTALSSLYSYTQDIESAEPSEGVEGEGEGEVEEDTDPKVNDDDDVDGSGDDDDEAGSATGDAESVDEMDELEDDAEDSDDSDDSSATSDVVDVALDGTDDTNMPIATRVHQLLLELVSNPSCGLNFVSGTSSLELVDVFAPQIDWASYSQASKHLQLDVTGTLPWEEKWRKPQISNQAVYKFIAGLSKPYDNELKYQLVLHALKVGFFVTTFTCTRRPCPLLFRCVQTSSPSTWLKLGSLVNHVL